MKERRHRQVIGEPPIFWAKTRRKDETGLIAHPEPRPRMQATATFCFSGMFRPHSIITGMSTSTPSVEILSTACARATLLRQVLLPTLSGLQGPERMAVKTIVSFGGGG